MPSSQYVASSCQVEPVQLKVNREEPYISMGQFRFAQVEQERFSSCRVGPSSLEPTRATASQRKSLNLGSTFRGHFLS